MKYFRVTARHSGTRLDRYTQEGVGGQGHGMENCAIPGRVFSALLQADNADHAITIFEAVYGRQPHVLDVRTA